MVKNKNYLIIIKSLKKVQHLFDLLDNFVKY